MERYIFKKEEESFLESLPQAVAVYQFVDHKIFVLALSDGFSELFGYADRSEAMEYMTQDLYRFCHPDDVNRLNSAALDFAEHDTEFDVIYRSRQRHGSEYKVIHATGKHIYKENGARLGYLWYTDEGIYTRSDNERASAFRRSLYDALHEESLLKASRYDYLTGLPSMAYFFELAEQGKREIFSESGQAVLLYFDLNGMKFFNSRHSFADGDRLLKEYAELFRKTFGNDHSCRAGADHFIAYAKDENVTEMLDALFQEISELNGGDSLTVRVGIYSTRLENVPVSVACDRAKFACDNIRKTYESSYNYYDSDLRDIEIRKQYIISHVDQAIEENWIQAFYQPIVRAVNGRVCDEEALARWIDPVYGFLSPGEFIPFLEEAGLIYKLDLCILDRVLEKLGVMKRADFYLVPQSINLSREDFNSCDIVEEITRRVDQANVPRELITIEITESSMGSDFEFMKEQVLRFQELGFPVWMDDFGSGYSSLDVLQSIRFDLLKFDMSFMKRLDENENGKIILTELMKMATALEVDTACEGVETEAQVRFLREIGCSKLQGFYYSKPVSLKSIFERYQNGIQIGFENPAESSYFETLGRINLYDLSVIANGHENMLQNFFNTLPMAIIELKGGTVQFTRSNQAYRDFMNRFFRFHLTGKDEDMIDTPGEEGTYFMRILKQCTDNETVVFLDEELPDGYMVHSFARRISVNPVTGKIAVAVAVLSVRETDLGTTYASIARALAADYYNIYYVNLETEQFIEYSSPVGGQELAMERHGENFFEAARRIGAARIFEEDREYLKTMFTKESILQVLDKQGLFTSTFRLLDQGVPTYVNMKIMRMQSDNKHLIIGVSAVDTQMKQREELIAKIREQKKEKNESQ